MIKNLETCGWKSALRGMRNPLKSHYKSDTEFIYNPHSDKVIFRIGQNDLKLCNQLIKAGASHRKFLRMIHIQCDITAPLKFWDEFSTYQFVVSNSESQMHLLGKRLLEESDFSSILQSTLDDLNQIVHKYQLQKSIGDSEKTIKKTWRKLIDNIPQSFLYTRTVDFSYEVFLSMYFNRKNHKLEEWRSLCETIREKAEYMDEFLKVLEPR